MKKTNLFLFIFALAAMAGDAASLAETREILSPSAVSSPEAIILDPGMASSCQNDLVVENMDGLVKAYMKDKDLDLITTKDKKVLWGTPKSGFAMKE